MQTDQNMESYYEIYMLRSVLIYDRLLMKTANYQGYFGAYNISISFHTTMGLYVTLHRVYEFITRNALANLTRLIRSFSIKPPNLTLISITLANTKLIHY